MNENCPLGLLKGSGSQPSFWSAVLRSRLPSLLVLCQQDIANHAGKTFPKETTRQQRMEALSSVISGEIGHLTNARDSFRAHSCVCERFSQLKQSLFAWPMFLVAQAAVLRKDHAFLRNILEAPGMEKAKAFETLVQLTVLVRLLSNQSHDLVPHLPTIRPADSFAATEILCVSQKATTIASVREEVQEHFSKVLHAQQVATVCVVSHIAITTMELCCWPSVQTRN